MDQVIAIAGELRVRLVLPFVDQWDWVGVRGAGHSSRFVLNGGGSIVPFTRNLRTPFRHYRIRPTQGIKSFARFRGFGNNLEDHFFTDARVRADFLVRPMF
jgi:hypothetical protein